MTKKHNEMKMCAKNNAEIDFNVTEKDLFLCYW